MIKERGIAGESILYAYVVYIPEFTHVGIFCI